MALEISPSASIIGAAATRGTTAPPRKRQAKAATPPDESNNPNEEPTEPVGESPRPSFSRTIQPDDYRSGPGGDRSPGVTEPTPQTPNNVAFSIGADLFTDLKAIMNDVDAAVSVRTMTITKSARKAAAEYLSHKGPNFDSKV